MKYLEREKKTPDKFLKIPQKLLVQNTSTYKRNEVLQNVKIRSKKLILLMMMRPVLLQSGSQSHVPLINLPCLRMLPCPVYSPMDEVEVQDKDYLPLTSVPAYTCGSD